MRLRSLGFFSFLFAVLLAPAAFAHDVTITGTTTFSALDGSSIDHDGVANGVFTVSDGSLFVNGVVNCNDDSTDSACSMAFAVSGDMSVGTGGALYAENRSGSGTGGAISLTVGGSLALSGNAIVSTAAKSSSSSTGGAITASVSGAISVGAGTTIDSGSANGRGGAIAITAGGTVTVDGNVLSGPSRTFLSTRLDGGAALGGGTSNAIGGAITIAAVTFVEPAIVVGGNANIVSQGADGGAGPVTLNGCGIQVRGLLAALSQKDSPAKVSIRSGKDVLIDGRDLGGSGTRMGRLRADAISGTAINKAVDIFAAETVDILGPSGAMYVITSHPGVHDSKSYGGRIRITSLGDAVNASGNLIDAGKSASGDTGGSIVISAMANANLNAAVIRAVGDSSTSNPQRGGGSIEVRSYSGNVIWTNGVGDVLPVGSNSGLAPADQGSIVLTACGNVDTTGSTYPVMGSPTSMFPETHTLVCSPAAPSLPAGEPALITCNTPPVANDVNASTNEDNTVTMTLSGSDADGNPLTFSIVSGPAHGSLGSIVPTGPTTATVNYTPDLNYNGSDSFVYQANDGNGGTDNATVSITIVAVNDPPSFLAGATVSVLEDSGAQTIPNWATSISAGPSDESGQTVTFTVTSDNAALFSVQPAVSSNGTLTFTPAANAYGVANLSIVAHDNGGTANGGNDTSGAQSSSITVTAVNDEPSFVKGADQTVNEDAGAQTVSGWATSITAGPNESGQSLTFTTSNDNNALFSAQPAVSASGMLTYTPATNAHGTATVSVTLHDDGGTADGGDDTSAAQTFAITINSVNDEPSFTGGGNVTVLEDSGAYSAAWASGISAGPADESSQTLSFSVSNNNNALFSVQPAIAADGTLTFTTATNAFGSATVTVTLSDNGGTANGGDDTSAPQTFTLTVTAVNDAPSFTSGGDVTVNEDSGSYSAAWASAINAGAGESGQTVAFVASNGNNALFSVQPSISSSGVLTFTPAPNAFGAATVNVYAQDNGGTANGGVDTSATITFTITVNGVNDPPTAGNDSWETEGNTELRVDHGTNTTPYVGDSTTSGKGVLDNDADAGEGDPLAVTGIVGCADTTAPFVCSVTGGTVTLESNGSFTFMPAIGATSASFQYTVTDIPSAGVPASATATVTIAIHDVIWYVNGSAAPGGNGTSTSPFNDFGSLDGFGDVDGAGDYIFVHNSAVEGSISLETNQKLWGEGVGLIIPRNLNGNGSPATLVAAGTRPTVTALTGDTVSVTGVTGVDIAGLSLTAASGNGIGVTSLPDDPAAGATIRSSSIVATAGEGIDINADSAAGTSVSIDGTDVTATGNGVDLQATAGDVVFSYSNGTVSSSAANGIVLDGSAAGSLTVTGLANVTISGTTAGDGISITSARFDASASPFITLLVNAGAMNIGTSADPVGGAALRLFSVSGDLSFTSLNAHGTTTGVTITGSGLFTGTAGMRVASGGGAVSAAGGAGLSIADATIAASNFSLTSVSSTGAVSGIVLNNTGSAGGLKVLGTGAAGTGGTIQNTSGDGVSLTATFSPAFNNVTIANTARSGVKGTQVNGFAFTNGSINASGTGGGTNESNIAFNTASSGTVSNVAGAVIITGNTLSNALWHGLDIQNFSGTISSLNVSGNTITSSTSTATSKGSAIRVQTLGSASSVANLTAGSITGNVISNFPSGGGVVVLGGNTATGGTPGTVGVAGSGTDIIAITGNTIRGLSAAIRMGTNAINVAVSGRGQGNFDISGNGTAGNPLTNIAGNVISVAANGLATATIVTSNNVIVANNSFGSSGIAGGTGIVFATSDTPSLTWTITGNIISSTDGNGILAVARGASGTLRARILNNTVAAPLAGVRQGIRIDAGNGASLNDSVCLDISGNTSAGSGGATGIGLRKQGTSTTINAFGIQGLPISPASSPVVEAFVDGQNSAGGGTLLISATSGFTACSFP